MKRQNVMIVDDTPANIEVVSESLGDEYEMIFATSGAEALDLIREDKPDLILLDIMMPGMDGYEVCSILKGDPTTRDIPIIFVTAMTQEEDEVKGLELGAIDYITKPVTPHVVKARVKNHLEMKRYRDLLENLSTAADRTKKEFLRGVSHELRTPLTPIIGMTDFVLTSERDDEKRKYLSLVQKAAIKLLGLIEDLIETSRLEGGAARLESRSFGIRSFLDGIIAELEPLATMKGIALSLTMDPELPAEMVADQGMLHKVISMLVGNAVKFTSEGEVALHAQRELAGNAVMVRFSISDTGIGIAEIDLERIFSDDFSQSDGSITRAFPGLGLGLTLARRIIELMEGKIWAQSRPGVGSIFHAAIPLVLAEEAAAADGAEQEKGE